MAEFAHMKGLKVDTNEKYPPIDVNTFSQTVPAQADDVVSEQANAASADLLKAVESFQQSFRERSFSGRNPDLGKMINCGVCGWRHRSSVVCEQRFAKVRIGHKEIRELAKKYNLIIPDQFRQTEPVNPKPRLGIGPKKRIKPHFSKRRLILVQRVKEFIEAMPEAEAFATEVRALMFQTLKRGWKNQAKIYRDTQKQSRTTNRAIC